MRKLLFIEIVDAQKRVYLNANELSDTKYLVFCLNRDSFIHTQIEIIAAGLAHLALPIYCEQVTIQELHRLLRDHGFEKRVGSEFSFEFTRTSKISRLDSLNISDTEQGGQIAVLLRQWDAYELTKNCITDLQLTTYQNLDIIILDDASSDLSYIKLFIEFSGVHIIRTLYKMEYCASFNFLARYSEIINADYIFVLNNDTKGFSENIFEQLLEAFQDNSVGIVSSRVMDFHGNFRLKQDRTWLGIKFNIATEGYLIPIPIWKKVRGFNPRLIRFAEDLEFIYQLEHLGYKQKRIDSVSFDHLGSGSSSRQNFVPVYFSVRNLIWIQKLYFPDHSTSAIVMRSIHKTWPVVSRVNSKDQKRHLMSKVTYLVIGIVRGVFSKLDTRPNETDFLECLSRSPLGLARKLP